MKKSHGFTLVELLVVVAIISVLAAMLLPTMELAMRQTRMIACQNHMKQQYLGVAMYENDAGRFPTLLWEYPLSSTYNCAPIDRADQGNMLRTPNSGKIFWTGMGLVYAGGYLADPRVLWCPEPDNYAKTKYTGMLSFDGIAPGTPSFVAGSYGWKSGLAGTSTMLNNYWLRWCGYTGWRCERVWHTTLAAPVQDRFSRNNPKRWFMTDGYTAFWTTEKWMPHVDSMNIQLMDGSIRARIMDTNPYMTSLLYSVVVPYYLGQIGQTAP